VVVTDGRDEGEGLLLEGGDGRSEMDDDILCEWCVITPVVTAPELLRRCSKEICSVGEGWYCFIGSMTDNTGQIRDFKLRMRMDCYLNLEMLDENSNGRAGERGQPQHYIALQSQSR
jgi:hypothetical protein